LRIERLEDRFLLHGGAHNGQWEGVTETGGIVRFSITDHFITSVTVMTPGDGPTCSVSNSFNPIISIGNNHEFFISQGGTPSYQLEGTIRDGWADGTLEIFRSARLCHTERWTTRRPFLAPATIDISRSSGSIDENGGRSNLNASADFPWAMPRRINLAFSGTATPGADYTLSPPDDFVIPAFKLTAQTRLTAANDPLIEGNETINVRVIGVDNGEIVDPTALPTITILDDDANTPPRFSSPSTAAVPENSTAVMTITATDSDQPAQTIIFSIAGGADEDQFNLTTSGMLTFRTAPNFEAPSDANSDNMYAVTIQASDSSGGTATQAINVTITNVNERLEGDYDDSGTVDTADYVVWRKSLNMAVPMFTGADGNGNGTVDQGDYDVWRANFGRAAPSGSGASVAQHSPDDAQPYSAQSGSTEFGLALQADIRAINIAKSRPRHDRPLAHSTFADNASVDLALIALLRQLSTGSQRNLQAVAAIELPAASVALDNPHQSAPTLDAAFATLIG
jgi:hypothetical protein